jgi:Tannase and feruloyl esterase
MRDLDVHSYYRLFESPGLGHCFGGAGGYPASLFDDLVAWVEKGVAPDNMTVSITDINGVENSRILCPYPQKARYDGSGDPTVVESFYCAM